MSRKSSLAPVYDFYLSPEEVPLDKGEVVIELGKIRTYGYGHLSLRLFPSPRLTISTQVENKEEIAYSFISPNPPLLFYFKGQKIDGFCSSIDGINSSDKTINFVWAPKKEALILGDIKPSNTMSAIFHIFNFLDFKGTQARTLSDSALLQLETNDWSFCISSLANGATKSAWENIKSAGGYYLTHVARLQRKDGQTFSGEDALKQKALLSNFLSVLAGSNFYTVCDVGLDAQGKKLWEAFSSPNYSDPSSTWFSKHNPQQAEDLFPLFAKRWQQSEEWKDCLNTVVYWYARANSAGPSPGIDTGIILAQVALERLAFHYLVLVKRSHTINQFKKLRASERLRLLFKKLRIPLAISKASPGLLEKKTINKSHDAPHALTIIRNNLVHPIKKDSIDGCYLDAWKLSLWYLELSILALCGYNGSYINRLTASTINELEPVPWSNQ